MSETPQLRGRPPKGPKSGKGNVLTTRITAETREALEAEAERTGRSISQVAEIWLDEARKGQADYHARLGGTQLAATIEKIVRISGDVDRVVEPELRRTALLAAWEVALPSLIDHGPLSANEIAIETQKRRAWDAYEAMVTAIEDAPESDPVRRAFFSPERRSFHGGVIGRVLAAREGFVRASDLRELLGTGDTAQDEIRAAVAEQEKVDALRDEWANRRRDAKRLGVDVAVAHGARQAIGEGE